MLLSKFQNSLKLRATISSEANINKDYSDYKPVEVLKESSSLELMENP